MTISLRLSDEDAEIIRCYAKLKNQSVSEVMRRAVLEQISNEYDLAAYEKTLKEHSENEVTYSLYEIEESLGL